MDSFQTLILVIFFAALLVGISQKIHMPYPIALVLGGIALGFIPGLQTITFDPNLLLVVVLPPILYYASFSIFFREFKKNWKEIFSLALGLVVLTTLVIGALFKWLFPEYPWALAFAFGAIVSPPDAISTTAIMKRFNINPTLLGIVEGESLINDASALVLYKLAVASLLSGIFSFTEASIEFAKIVSGGVLIGFALGLILQNLSRRFLDPVVGVLFSFSIPYITYLLADGLGVSGVLAVVVNGLIGSRILAKHQSSLRRILGFAFWDIFNILLNCFVFILIGLEMRTFLSAMTLSQIVLYTAYACLITLAMTAVRLLWVYSKSFLTYLIGQMSLKQTIKEATLVGWSGMRGIVSLTAALALPLTIEGRNEVVFITFIIILITLFLPSTTLSYLIRRMKMDQHSAHKEAHLARKRLLEVAEKEIHLLHGNNEISYKEYHFLLNYFHLQRYVYEISRSSLRKMTNLEMARLKVLQKQRQELLALWEKEQIHDKLFRELEHELDVEESHLARAELI